MCLWLVSGSVLVVESFVVFYIFILVCYLQLVRCHRQTGMWFLTQEAQFFYLRVLSHGVLSHETVWQGGHIWKLVKICNCCLVILRNCVWPRNDYGI